MDLKLQQKLFTKLCLEMGCPAPFPEFKFHEKRKWRIDYYFENERQKVGLEVQGGLFMHQGKGGRHNRATGYLKDMEKSNAMATSGIFLLQVTPQTLLKKTTVEMIKAVLFCVT